MEQQLKIMKIMTRFCVTEASDCENGDGQKAAPLAGVVGCRSNTSVSDSRDILYAGF